MITEHAHLISQGDGDNRISLAIANNNLALLTNAGPFPVDVSAGEGITPTGTSVAVVAGAFRMTVNELRELVVNALPSAAGWDWTTAP